MTRRGVGLRPPDELMALVLGLAGLDVTSLRVITFIHEWARAEGAVRERIGPERFVELSPISRATVYRRLEEFRRIFPGKDTPADLIRWPHGYPAADDVSSIEWASGVAT